MTIQARRMKEKHTSRRRSIEVMPIKFLRPGSYWPQPLSIEQAFEAMAEIVRRADDPRYTQSVQWGYMDARQLIDGRSGLSSAHLRPIGSIDDLRSYFHHAYLGDARCEAHEVFRREQGIEFHKPLRIPAGTYKPWEGVPRLGLGCEASIQAILETFFVGAAGRKMAVSLNSCHPDCRTLHHVQVQILNDGRFAFQLTYGDRTPGDRGSSWTDAIAVTAPGESFLDTLARARDVFSVIVDGQKGDHDFEAVFGDLLRDEILAPAWLKRQIVAVMAGGWNNPETRPDGSKAGENYRAKEAAQ